MATRTVPQRSLPGPPSLPLLGGWANLLKLFGDSYTYSRWLHSVYGDVVAMAHGDPTIPQDRRFERVPVRVSIHRLVEFV